MIVAIPEPTATALKVIAAYEGDTPEKLIVDICDAFIKKWLTKSTKVLKLDRDAYVAFLEAHGASNFTSADWEERVGDPNPTLDKMAEYFGADIKDFFKEG